MCRARLVRVGNPLGNDSPLGPPAVSILHVRCAEPEPCSGCRTPTSQSEPSLERLCLIFICFPEETSHGRLFLTLPGRRGVPKPKQEPVPNQHSPILGRFPASRPSVCHCVYVPLRQCLPASCDSVNTNSAYCLCESSWKEEGVSFLKTPFTELGGPKRFDTEHGCPCWDVRRSSPLFPLSLP